MADYKLNCVPSFKKERIVYFILGNNYTCDMHLYVTYRRGESIKVYHVNAIWQSYHYSKTIMLH